MRPSETSAREKKDQGRLLRHISIARVNRRKDEGNRNNYQHGRWEGECGGVECKGRENKGGEHWAGPNAAEKHPELN